MVAAGIARFSAPIRRWNSTGAAWSETRRGRRRPRPGGRPAVAADAGDDGAEHVGELGADDGQQPLGVGLGRGDLQQRDQLAGGGQPVLDEAVVAELDQFLGADPGGAQYFDGRPCPERAVFFGAQVAVIAGGQVFGPDAGGGAAGGGAGQGLPGGGDDVAGPGAAGGLAGRPRRRAAGRRSGPVGFRNSAIGPDLGIYAARSYSLMRPPRTGRRLICSWERSATGWSGRGGRSCRLRWGRRPL